jgi:outer membrane biogenesis lipoprotein LolB
MIRRKLFIVTAIVASVVLTACSDMTAPKQDASCPVMGGSQVCLN